MVGKAAEGQVTHMLYRTRPVNLMSTGDDTQRVGAECREQLVAARRLANHTQLCFFFFQAEDGIRDYKVTGVQTCALPIYGSSSRIDTEQSIPRFKSSNRVAQLFIGRQSQLALQSFRDRARERNTGNCVQIGRASCRERV